MASGAILFVKKSSVLTLHHYSRTCGEPEEIIDREERKNLARVYVRLESGRGMLQAGNG
jgi:hypothetical protein